MDGSICSTYCTSTQQSFTGGRWHTSCYPSKPCLHIQQAFVAMPVGRSKRQEWLTLKVTPKTRAAFPPPRQKLPSCRQHTPSSDPILDHTSGSPSILSSHKLCRLRRHVKKTLSIVQNPQQKQRISVICKLSNSKLQLVRNHLSYSAFTQNNAPKFHRSWTILDVVGT